MGAGRRLSSPNSEDEMTRDDMLTKLRDDRDAAAARGDLVEALILNDRIVVPSTININRAIAIAHFTT